MQIPPFVSLCKYGFWSHERTHSIKSITEVYHTFCTFQPNNFIVSVGELNSTAVASKAIAPAGFVKQAVGTIKERSRR